MLYTYRDVIYMVLDELKQFTTDIPFEEEHIATLLTISRAVIIKQKFAGQKTEIPMELLQPIQFNIIKDSGIIKSNREFDVINLNGMHMFYNVTVPSIPDVEFSQTTLDRFKYVRVNKWLSNVCYFTVSNNNVLYFKVPTTIDALFTSSYIEIPAYYNAILEDPRTAYPYESKYLDLDFAITGDMLRIIIDLTLADLYKHLHLPEDTINNGKNDLVQAQK